MMLKTWMAAGLASLALSACTLGAGDPADVAATPATSVRLVDRDVEAPEVFQTTDKALWDGRPSLGGVWVAAPDATNPERVLMRNAANGRFVIGGLFQRDASLPGPKLQLSSDAADALGLLAGEPAEISVTALRREEAPATVPDASTPLLDTNEPAGGLAAPPDIAATAAAAIDAATTGSPDAGSPTAAIPGAVKPQPKPPADPGQTNATPPPPTQPTAAASAQGSGSLIQIGIFSVEANARRARDLLTKSGVPAVLTPETSLGKPLWSVTARGDAAMLARVKTAGFADAYVLKR